MENDIFWSEIRSRFGEPGGTPPPRIAKSIPPPRQPAHVSSRPFVDRISSNNSGGAIVSFFVSKGADYSREGDYFKYFHQRGAI